MNKKHTRKQIKKLKKEMKLNMLFGFILAMLVSLLMAAISHLHPSSFCGILIGIPNFCLAFRNYKQWSQLDINNKMTWG